MREVVVDQKKCLAYGVCMMTEPAVFDLPDDDDVAHVVRQPVNDDEWANTIEAVVQCPAAAIAIVDV
jgi:ferredoxin